MTLRLVHPMQQGSRLSWRDSLFETVPMVSAEDTQPAELVPVPEVAELEWPAFADTEAQQ